MILPFPTHPNDVRMGQEVIYHIGFLAVDRRFDEDIDDKEDLKRRKAIDRIASQFLRRSNSKYAVGKCSQIRFYDGTNEFVLYQKTVEDYLGKKKYAYCAKRIKTIVLNTSAKPA